MNHNAVLVTGTVNAGVCLAFSDRTKLWFDFYPDRKTPYFSMMTDTEWNQARLDPSLYPPDLVFFSHTHPDHFSALRTQWLHSKLPGLPVWYPAGSEWTSFPDRPGITVPAPQEMKGMQLISGDLVRTQINGLSIEMIRTVHSGLQFLSVPHYSFLIRFHGKQIFISGDAFVTGDALTQYLEEHRIDLAVLTFPWASTGTGRERTEYSIQPSHVLLYHIPKKEEDRCGFRDAALSGASLLNVPDVRLLMEPFQKETFCL